MEYKGRLYGKVNNSYFPLEATTETFDALESRVKLLEKKLNIAEKALSDIAKWNDDLDEEWDDTGNRASTALKTMAFTNI